MWTRKNRFLQCLICLYLQHLYSHCHNWSDLPLQLRVLVRQKIWNMHKYVTFREQYNMEKRGLQETAVEVRKPDSRQVLASRSLKVVALIKEIVFGLTWLSNDKTHFVARSVAVLTSCCLLIGHFLGPWCTVSYVNKGANLYLSFTMTWEVSSAVII